MGFKTEWNLNILYTGFQDEGYLKDKEALAKVIQEFTELTESAAEPLTAAVAEAMLLKREQIEKLIGNLFIYASLRQSATSL